MSTLHPDRYDEGIRDAAEAVRERRKLAVQLLGPTPMPFSMEETYIDAIRAIESLSRERGKI